MAFDLTAQPDGEHPEEYYQDELGWPDNEYIRPPNFSGKFVRDSDILSKDVVGRLYGSITANEALSIAETIDAAIKEYDAADPEHLQRLAGFTQWLRYWGKRGIEISGGP